MPLPKLLAVVGPTASGKTAVGVALARAFDGEVIAADSRTIYKDMNVGTAKPEGQFVPKAVLPSEGEEGGYMVVEGIKHWGIDLVTPDKTFTVAEFQEYADKKIKKILGRGKVPILVGGTGLYFRALIDRPTFSEIPPNPDLRIELATLSNAQLMEEIGAVDPDTAATIDEDNRRRLERAVEILRATGKPLAETQKRTSPLYDVLQLGMEVDREQLYRRIDERVDMMIAQGLVNEVRNLRNKYGADAPGMTGIGYRQVNEFLDGKMKLKEAVMRIKYDSHHYAKRQETWFKRDPRVIWVKTPQQALTEAQKFFMSDTSEAMKS